MEAAVFVFKASKLTNSAFYGRIGVMTPSHKKEVRVRFAPSPTGPFHLGSARTALFNWLFAKNQGGKFTLRIEDTDKERSQKEYEKDIFDSLKWLGLDWDEGPGSGAHGPYRQSERLDIYEKYLKQLLRENKAYYCFCSKEQLEGDRQAMLAQGLPPKYSGRCRSISLSDAQKRITKGELAVIRFKIPEVDIEFQDIIRGKVKFNGDLIGDIIIAKSLLEPLYNFSATCDDQLMAITHVVRGEDHISNTPKQIFIQKALGFDELKYAHLPLLLAPDRSKLSKRYMETSLIDYKNQGYLPDAIINFLALLGWHPALQKNETLDEAPEEKEILSREELIKEFDLKRVQKAGAVFNIDKLEWMNARYIKNKNAEELTAELKDFIPKEWSKNEKLLIKSVEIERERMKKLSDFKNLADFIFTLPDYPIELLFWPRPAIKDALPLGDKGKIGNNLKLIKEELEKIAPAKFNKTNLEKAIMPLTDVWGRGDLLWPLRVALSGRMASPGPFEIMDILGRAETLARLEKALAKLK